MIILAIESSCDDTSVAIMKNGEILSNVTATQLDHVMLGGVVPEVASRAHQQKIVYVVDKALSEAGVKKEALNAIGFTQGPGLMGSLIVGVSFAKSLALSLNIPIIAVHHLHAHILSHFIEAPRPGFPFLCLTVSGGHTMIVKVDSPSAMTVLGHTIDDAAGEAFDKCGKLLGLPYPAGPVIDKIAKDGKAIYNFTEPRIEGLNFSFSGLKTSFLYFLKKELKSNPNFIKENLNNLAASIQERIVSILLHKIEKAVHQYDIKEIAIAGGVSANSALRSQFKQKAAQEGWGLYIPKLEYCTDNAAMIAQAAYFKYKDGEFAQQNIAPSPRLAF